MINKKTIGIITCIILLGAVILPTINGYQYTKTKSNHEGFSDFSLSDDYINAYWKFDEGSGNTEYDSSGNGYDGTIYGATWTTDTPSGSGYALNFDGSGDYVDFDNHAQYDLGFNKSDDAIFTFYFKSTSTNKGIIYSISRGDQYGYNPGIEFALSPNGTLEVMFYRAGCGILLYTNGVYNDGSWHFAEIVYNGESANPTVDIFIDNQFDNVMKRWVCYFYSDNFHHADIGRNSYDFTDYYNGKIDEFKMILYRGGNEQLPPIIDGPTHGAPNVEYDYTFTVVDPEGDDCEINIDFDGTQTGWMGPYETGDVVTISHKWDYEGNFSVRSKSRDYWGESYWSYPFYTLIGNIPPNPPTIIGPTTGKANILYDFTFNSEDPNGDDVKFNIDWGDGENDVTSFVGSGTDVTVSHSWSEKGTYTVTVYAEDEYGAISEETTGEFVVEKSKSINKPLIQFLQSHPKMFPLLQKLIQQQWFGL